MYRDPEVDPNKQLRFWRKVDQSAGPSACWPWLGTIGGRGYGRHFVGWTTYAHRVAFRLGVGPFDLRARVKHLCGSKGCCNPAHLWLSGCNARPSNSVTPSVQQRYIRPIALHSRRGERAPVVRLSWAEVREIRQRAGARERQASLARTFGVSQPAISQIVRRRTWVE
jgi:hypothetical protein